MIGVFDSGIGGVTVLEALRRELPRRDFVYVADTARLPYGSKQPAVVREFAREIVDFLCGLDAEGIVIACNTASAAALPELRLAYPLPVWGMVDACVETATRATCSGRVAVIGTEGTIASGVYQRKLGARGLRVWARACPALVQAAEENWNDPEPLVRHYLREMPRVDTLLLACTHFGWLRGAIQRVAGPRVRVVDGAEELARTVGQEMENEGSGRVRYYATGQAGRLPGLCRSERLHHSVQQTALAEVSRGIEIVHI
jgi:glutamate racemase